MRIGYIPHRMIVNILIFMTLILIVSCGQKGPLVLPKETNISISVSNERI